MSQILKHVDFLARRTVIKQTFGKSKWDMRDHPLEFFPRRER
jgi:hypothetical protein